MILEKYKDTYDKFISKYEEIHVNPWHNISKEELDKIYHNLVTSMDINDKYSFIYFMNYIIKKLNGKSDAHTKLRLELSYYFLPVYFRIFDNTVICMAPLKFKNAILKSINDIPIETIIKEIDDVISYGTEGKRIYETEKSLFNTAILYSLPSLRNSNELSYKMVLNEKIIITTYKQDETILEEDKFPFINYCYQDNATYRFENNCLIYTHKSVQNQFKDKIKNAIDCLRQINLDNIDTIIIDLRGNFGGNASLNKYLMDFLKENADKKLFVLTDYRVFSGGRYALRDLINLGAVTIGDEISTPINCYGNCYLEKINKYWTFTISEHYYHPMLNISFKSKEEYQNGITSEISKDYIFHPNILVKETIKDFINNNDPVLQKALELAAKKSKHI